MGMYQVYLILFFYALILGAAVRVGRDDGGGGMGM